MNIIRPALWLLLGSALAQQQNLGIVFVQEWTNAGQKIIATTHIDGARLRQEWGVGSSHEVQIFDSIEHVLWTLDPEHKSYIEVRKLDVDEVVRGPLERDESPNYLYRRAGPGQVGQWPCTVYEVFRPENFRELIKDSELCLVELGQLKLTSSDISANRDRYEFGWRYSLLPYGAMLAGPPRFPLTEVEGLSGVPVRRIRFASDGSIVTTSELKEFRRAIIPPSLFEVPADYTKLTRSDQDVPILPAVPARPR